MPWWMGLNRGRGALVDMLLINGNYRIIEGRRSIPTASTSEFTGLRGFSRRSGGMMGWAAISSQTWFSFRRASSCLSHRHAT